MNTNVRTVLLLLAVLLSATLTAPGSHRVLAQAAPQPPARGQDCVMVVAPLRPGETISRIESYQCARTGQPVVVPNASTLIMTWYVGDRYNGASTRIYGRYGPCDSEGYGINYVGDAWNDRITSFKVWNNCAYTRAYTAANYGGDCNAWYGNVSNVGNYFNDKISSFWVASRSKLC